MVTDDNIDNLEDLEEQTHTTVACGIQISVDNNKGSEIPARCGRHHPLPSGALYRTTVQCHTVRETISPSDMNGLL